MQSRSCSTVPSSRRTRRAFTLLELLIVLAIIGVIAAMVVPKFINSQQQANLKLSRTSIMNAEKALELYAVEHDGEFPPGSAGRGAPEGAAVGMVNEPGPLVT